MFTRKHMIWQIFPQYIILILISLVVVTLYSTDALKHLYLQRTRMDLKTRARLIGQLVLTDITQLHIEKLNNQIRHLAQDLDIRITVILPDGRVIADSEEDYQDMENHADRPEIIEAFHGHVGSSSRFSYTFNLNMLYMAVPVTHQNKTISVVRVSMPSSDLDDALKEIYRKIIIMALLVILMAGIIGFLYTYYFNKPIRAIKDGARAIGNGELNHRIYMTKPEELKIISQSINHMADQLKDRIDQITSQRNELEAVLTSMVEAVLLVDTQEKIIRINNAMSKMYHIKPEEAIDKNLHEVIRNIGLQRFVQKTLNSKDLQEAEFTISGKNECTVQAHGTLIKDSSGKTIGSLIVMNDTTQQKALENMRREFVTNVSHELKTPITAIQGFVETLREGAVHDKNKAVEFLDIIIKHSDRLNAIIEDLLNLSKIEQDAEKGQISLETSAIRQVLQEALTLCQNKASEKNIQLKLESKPDIKVKINTPLLSQALVNLIDNAIKYSPAKSTVTVSVQKKNHDILIQVKDNGAGISEKDLQRIFERFYRVDKARSRQLGGTGLGLSIVKHIAQAHGGSVYAVSTLGEGSCFTIALPDSSPD